MIRHIFKLIWNRRKANFLIMTEIFFSFIVLYAVVTMAVFYLDNKKDPLGFTYENQWVVEIDTKGSSNISKLASFRQLFANLRTMDEVVSVSGMSITPFSSNNWNGSTSIKGKRYDYEATGGTDDLVQTLDLHITRGRWFTPDDGMSNKNPVVINEHFAQAVFGAEDPIGKPLFDLNNTDKPTEIVGVITNYKKDGEYAASTNFYFERMTLQDTTGRIPETLVIKVRPGTTAQFEEKLSRLLQGTVKEWTFSVESLTREREDKISMYITPLIVASLIAAFLIAMVALGLIGIIWQNVMGRISEIGLRRATGATKKDINWQILGELLMITSLGMLAALILVIQFPILGVLSFVSTKVYIIALLISVLSIYAVTVLCGIYPSMLATKIQPTEALHAE
ncbi:FtsX-like permease family protein [Rhodocytophaga rosea]|uniref:FtsX-like permease family protein n=1 Tax=Rhodocytophaga rosea TaxID=2704465 RepID=A0A6C0GJF5_9BACT|nr:ABC transporter permease [Rhodocytophaga rosea]QHT67792.1 FtsX-like permease family protein [Rhodocytophaga rosea]